MTKANNATGWYSNVFKHWPTKLVGVQPTATQLDTIHLLGARPGKQALANAMALRDGGVTGGQIQIACGAPQLNKMRGFVTDGLMKFEATPPAENGHKVYKLVVTSKGQARIERARKAIEAAAANAGAEKPVKAKAKRKAKAKPASEPVVTTDTVTEGQATQQAPANNEAPQAQA